MKDFNLVLKELIKKEDINITISDDLKKEFELTAQRYIKNENLLDAIKVFAITKNKQKLIETADLCLKNNKFYEALYGYCYADDKENLNKVGFIFLNLPDIKAALNSFKKAENKEMVLFLELNLF